MCISKKKIFMLMLGVFSAVTVCAQSRLVNPLADSFLNRLRAGGQMYIVPNVRIGQETLAAGMRSRVAPGFKERMKYKAYVLGNKHLSPVLVERLVVRNWVKEPLPAYYVNFEKAWRQMPRLFLGRLEVVLEAAYGEETSFDGFFVQTYPEVLNAAMRTQLRSTARKALKRGYEQGMQKQYGFFVITVHETPEHGYDVLLLDVATQQFISVGQSLGQAWMQDPAKK